MPQITLIGRLVRDPELRFTPGGAAVTSLSIVTSDRYKDKNDEWQENNTVFWDCTAWRDLAERIAEAGLVKGDAVIGVGKTSTDEWEDRKTGDKRSKIKVTLDAFGPDTRWMLVTAKRAQRAGATEGANGFGREGAGTTVEAQPAEDPWATPPASSQASFDEPPF